MSKLRCIFKAGKNGETKAYGDVAEDGTVHTVDGNNATVYDGNIGPVDNGGE